MSSDEGGHHAKQVDAWIKQMAGGLPSERLLRLFYDAICAIHNRSAKTLSDVTLSAVFDRVLLASQKKFSLLAKVRFESKGVSLDALFVQSSDLAGDEIKDAFRFFLVELLTLLGNLTADILTKPLYQELFKVTAESAQSGVKAGHRGLRSIKSGSDQGDV